MCSGAIETLRGVGVARVDVGLVLGSGLGDACPTLRGAVKIPYRDLPGAREPGVSGHAGYAVYGEVGGRLMLAFLGRVHLYEGATLDQVVFQVRLLAALQARALIVTQAAGAANPRLEVPGLMLVRDQVNLMGRSFPFDPPRGPLYAPRLRARAREIAAARGMALGEGILAGFLGPSYETPAEVRVARSAAADALTMSTLPEVVAARSLGMEVVGFSVLTNRAPHAGGRIQHDAVVRHAAEGARTLRPLLAELCPHLAA